MGRRSFASRQNIEKSETNSLLLSYFDKHGKAPPNPDPAQFEQLQYFTPENHFRISGDGLGVTTAQRYSGVSMLKDGSVLGFLDFFTPVEQAVS
jgi:hypothetical protein